MAANSDDMVAWAGDRVALDEIFARHRSRLQRMVETRLDRLERQLPGGMETHGNSTPSHGAH
jgi:hypothetical protein